ncbi:MAG: Gfo/Idh/MocA family oxidoreductase, partial [Planctomycetaceae bacterium]
MYRTSRREFLEQSMLAAAAAVATTSVGRSASAEEEKAAEGSDSPSEVLRVAQLGVNGQGSGHLGQWIGRKGCEVVAIVDPDESVGQTKGVERIEKESGKKPAYYKDLREAFEKTEIDIVSIATPNHWHALAAIWAIQAGKDVYVEKPVSHNVSEGRRIVQAARKHQKIVQTGTQCRSMQGTREAIEFVKSGMIGEVKLARGLCYKNRPSIGARGVYDVPPGIDYNIWLGPAPEVQLSRPRFHYDWHWQWDYGNGDLGNQGIHQMDIARCLIWSYLPTLIEMGMKWESDPQYSHGWLVPLFVISLLWMR